MISTAGDVNEDHKPLK